MDLQWYGCTALPHAASSALANWLADTVAAGFKETCVSLRLTDSGKSDHLRNAGELLTAG